MNKITFKEAIRLVHPDTNPNIVDAGVKVNDVMLYKNDEESLYKLVSSWGLLGSQSTSRLGSQSIPKEPQYVTEKVLFKLYPNAIYRGHVFVNITGWIIDFAVERTTKARVYFTKETKAKTGRTCASFSKVRNSFIINRRVI